MLCAMMCDPISVGMLERIYGLAMPLVMACVFNAFIYLPAYTRSLRCSNFETSLLLVQHRIRQHLLRFVLG